jgi:hypothetical protein
MLSREEPGQGNSSTGAMRSSDDIEGDTWPFSTGEMKLGENPD